ncbi:MAG: hypothetical protein R6V23_16255 [Bacteroidales bacterium]
MKIFDTFWPDEAIELYEKWYNTDFKEDMDFVVESGLNVKSLKNEYVRDFKGAGGKFTASTWVTIIVKMVDRAKIEMRNPNRNSCFYD